MVTYFFHPLPFVLWLHWNVCCIHDQTLFGFVFMPSFPECVASLHSAFLRYLYETLFTSSLWMTTSPVPLVVHHKLIQLIPFIKFFQSLQYYNESGQTWM